MTAAAQLVRDYWAAMNSNDWAAVSARFLAPDFRLLWLQSNEVVAGRDAFARVNAAFHGQGGWGFETLTILAEGDRVVSDTRVSNPALEIVARVITFHDIADGLIRQQTEFWPDAYDAPEWRRGLTQHDPEQARF